MNAFHCVRLLSFGFSSNTPKRTMNNAIFYYYVLASNTQYTIPCGWPWFSSLVHLVRFVPYVVLFKWFNDVHSAQCISANVFKYMLYVIIIRIIMVNHRLFCSFLRFPKQNILDKTFIFFNLFAESINLIQYWWLYIVWANKVVENRKHIWDIDTFQFKNR